MALISMEWPNYSNSQCKVQHKIFNSEKEEFIKRKGLLLDSFEQILCLNTLGI